MKLRDKISAFSLIEIVQTVVLLGIIAGISVSFFKKVNTDVKLQEATEVKLFEALKEANNLMCNDDTPYCHGSYAIGGGVNIAVDFPLNDYNHCCSTKYNLGGASVTYNAAKGYCEEAPVGGACPDAANGMSLYTNNDGTTTCFGVPTCYKPGACGTILFDPGLPGVEILAKPLHEITCPADTPRWNAYIERVIDPADPATKINPGGTPQVTEICYRLWSVINHNKKGASDYNDLIRACQTDSISTAAAATCIINNHNNCTVNNADAPPNMVLPNGVALYNLNCIGKGSIACPTNAANQDAQNLYIKFDRNFVGDLTFDADSAHKTKNTSIFNAVYAGGPNNLTEAAPTEADVLTIQARRGTTEFNDTNLKKYSESFQSLYNINKPTPTP